MKKIIFTVLFLISSLSADTFKKPVSSFKASGYVVDILYKKNKLYVATDAGVVDIFNTKTKKIVKNIKVPKTTDFMGDEVDSKVFSVDELDNNILLLSKSLKGFNRIHIYTNNKLSLLIDYKQGLSIIKAKYLDKNTLIFALLSNELISYDIKNKKINYRLQVNGGKFSDFALSEDKLKIVVTDESGVVTLIDTKSGKINKILKAQNLDNVFQIAYKSGVVATAGQDRRVAIYVPKFNSSYYNQVKFIVYSVGLSPNGKFVAFASDELNNITLKSTITKSTIAKFGGNKATISDIEFIDENYFFVASNSQTINLYKIK